MLSRFNFSFGKLALLSGYFNFQFVDIRIISNDSKSSMS